MRTKKQNNHRTALQRETAYLLKNKANRDALKQNHPHLRRESARVSGRLVDTKGSPPLA